MAITSEVSAWLTSLPDDAYEQVMAVLVVLRREGPSLGSRRIIFAFDMQRTAVLLVAGDERGQWSRWYTEAIPEAERRFTAWMEREERP